MRSSMTRNVIGDPQVLVRSPKVADHRQRGRLDGSSWCRSIPAITRLRSSEPRPMVAQANAQPPISTPIEAHKRASIRRETCEQPRRRSHLRHQEASGQICQAGSAPHRQPTYHVNLTRLATWQAAQLTSARAIDPVLRARAPSADAQLCADETALRHAKDKLVTHCASRRRAGRATRFGSRRALAQPVQCCGARSGKTRGCRKLQGDPAQPPCSRQPADLAIGCLIRRSFKGMSHSSAGSGAAFSVLPPENATGSLSRWCSRLPVRSSSIRRHVISGPSCRCCRPGKLR